jgi:Tol biopolymer transport system component
MSVQRRFHPAIALGLVVAALALTVIAILVSRAGVRITDASPVDVAEGVPITAPVRLIFSQPMDTPSVEARFHIEPAVAGRLVWEGREATFWPHSALAPETHYTVTVEAGAASQRGSTLQEDYRWHFRTRAPSLLFLGRAQPGQGERQLFVAASDGTSIVGSSTQQLTDHAGGVWDYAVHPLGESIVYSVLRDDGGSDLWRMDRDGANQRILLGCPGAACLNPAWSADGWQLAYERRDIWADAPNLDPNAGRIWLFDLEKKRQRPLFDYDVPLHSPVWAPQGERLAYVSPALPGIEVYDLPTDELQQYGNEWGAAPVWSPDGTQLVLPELMLAGESLVVRLVRIDLETDELLDISGGDDEEGLLVKDVAPAWSPAGGWIATARQYLDEERWTPGRQIWLTRPDGTETYSLLIEPMGDHYALTWRPDGAALAYVRSDLSEGPQPVPDVSVWVFDLIQREPALVARDGVLPRWLP